MSQENNFVPNQQDYKPLSPFKLFVKSNFPFIENTFEALDNYGLYCKIVEYLNTVIENENTVESNVQNLYNAFVSLNNYVSNYFDNLDVQEEINNKLDDLVEDGTMAEIINQEIFGEINNKIATLENNNNYKLIVVSDSYGIQQFDASPIIKYFWEMIAENLNLTENVSIFPACRSGASFNNGNFLGALQTAAAGIDNKNEITHILIAGGWNDSYNNITEQNIIDGMTSFNTYAKTTFPNAKIKLAHVGYSNPYITDSSANVSYVLKSIESYKKGASQLGWTYIQGSEYILHDYTANLWQADGVHPSQLGQNQLGQYLTEGFLSNSIEINRKNEDTGTDMTASGVTTSIARTKLLFTMNNNVVHIDSQQNFGGATFTLNNTTSINCNGATEYEIGTINCPYWYGWNSRNGVTVPAIIFSSAANQLYNGIVNLICRQGKLYAYFVFLDSTNHPINGAIQYLYLSSLHLKSITRYC